MKHDKKTKCIYLEDNSDHICKVYESQSKKKHHAENDGGMGRRRARKKDRWRCGGLKRCSRRV